MPSGGSWSRLGVVQDSTYPTAASVGVGLRGTTGRVDDSERGRSEHRPRPARRLPSAPSQAMARSHSPGLRRAPTAARRSRVTPVPRDCPQPDGRADDDSRPDDVHGHHPPERDDALLQSRGCQRERRRREVERGKRDADRAVAPTTLSTPVDDFNRPNETLSDVGRWTNAIIAGESGFAVSSNQLACSVTTTCTARRNNVQFGPEVEVWARMTTLPGLNNQLRLYARLQSTTGYVLRTNQTSGGGEVWLERFNGGLTRLLTIPSQLAAGDTMLLRAKGSTIEAWRLPSGGSWSRVGFVQDSTYSAAAFVGVGLRGTTGRLTTSEHGRSAALRPTPRRPPTRRTCRQVRSARPRSTSPGRPPPTRAASTCTGSSAAPAPAAATSPRSRPCRATRRPSPTRA